MSTAQNIDVTDQWKSKLNVVSEFEKILRDASVSLIEEKTVSLHNGRWVSTDDPKSGVEIKDGKFIMFYKGTETTTDDVYDYKLTEDKGVEYLILIDKTGDELKYSLLKYTDEIFVMSYYHLEVAADIVNQFEKTLRNESKRLQNYQNLV